MGRYRRISPADMKPWSLPGELWADTSGYTDRYLVSNFGRVASLRAPNGWRQVPRFSKLKWEQRGYCFLDFTDDTGRHVFRVHRAVARAFVPGYREELFVNHKDGDKSNNRADNLEWVTARDNVRHAYHTGLMPRKLSDTQLINIRHCKGSLPQYQIAEAFGVTPTTVSRVMRGRHPFAHRLERLGVL